MSVICDYCEQPAELVTGAVVYPHRPDLAHKKVWRCVPCDARVGCHGDTDRPLGRLANADLRFAKMSAHAAFDTIWITGVMSRNEAYAWLANELGLTREECHVGMFDVAQCERVVAVSETLMRSREGVEAAEQLTAPRQTSDV